MLGTTTSSFNIERLWLNSGEDYGVIADNIYLITMSDTYATEVEWSTGDRPKRKRSRVFVGDAWIWSPGQSWWMRREVGKACIQLSLSSEWLSRLFEDPLTLSTQVQVRDLLLSQLLRALLETTNGHIANPVTQLYQENLASTVILHLVTNYERTIPQVGRVTPLSTSRLRLITEYVSEHLAETVSLAQLAGLVGLSPSQFSPRFKETTGQTPHEYIMLIRLNKARELLVSHNHTPGEVAVLTGFADQSHLTRHIRRSYGVTPRVLTKR